MDMENQTHTTNKLVSQDSKVLGAEDVSVPSGASVKAVHTQATEVHERIQETKSKMNNVKMETNVKMNVSGGIGVQGGAQSMTGKVLGGVGKGIGFINDPFGLKKKQADQQVADTQKQVGDGVAKGLNGMETKTETKTTETSVKDYWISPSIPGMGLAKMSSWQQSEQGDMNVSQSGGMYGAGGNPMAMNGMSGMAGMMGGMKPKRPAQPKVVTVMEIDQMGTSGAKSELE